MKRNLFVLTIVLMTVALLIVVFQKSGNQKFYLEDKYYGNGNYEEIEASELDALIDDRESFVLFVYQPGCVNSANFEKVLDEFIDDEDILIKRIAFSDIKDTSIGDDIKYYPSFAIFNKGTMVDYLDAESSEDLNYYNSLSDFKDWFTSYVNLKEVEASSDNVKTEENTISDEDLDEVATNVNLEDVTYSEDKVNIYFFWGSTCPHCEEEFKFFEEIEDEYGDYYNLHAYEVWENPDNLKIMYAFGDALGEDATGVPYTIIGDESFTGFSDSRKDEFIEAITSKHENSKDIYFDKIKS